MKLSPDGNTLYITNSYSDSLEVIDLKRAIQLAGSDPAQWATSDRRGRSWL